MGLLEFVSELVITLDKDGDTKCRGDRMNQVNAFFILLYAFLTGALIWLLLGSNYSIVFIKPYSPCASIAEDRLGHIVLNYSLFMASLASIHLWIYMARRFYIGMHGKDGFFRSQEFEKSYRNIWNQSKRWFNPFPYNMSYGFEKIIKPLYLLSWIVLCLIVLSCVNNMGIFEFYKICRRGICFYNPIVLFAVFTYLISMVLNYASYFMCIAFSVFIRNVSNHAADIEFNHNKPSNTPGFQMLIHASSRVAIAFFFDSMLYVILSAIEIEIAKRFHIINAADTIGIVVILMCVLVPCILSFVLVYLLPKMFLSRLLRKWKFMAAERVIGDTCISDIDEDRNNMLSETYGDHLPLIKAELMIAVATVVVEAASLIVSLNI